MSPESTYTLPFILDHNNAFGETCPFAIRPDLRSGKNIRIKVPFKNISKLNTQGVIFGTEYCPVIGSNVPLKVTEPYQNTTGRSGRLACCLVGASCQLLQNSGNNFYSGKDFDGVGQSGVEDYRSRSLNDALLRSAENLSNLLNDPKRNPFLGRMMDDIELGSKSWHCEQLRVIEEEERKRKNKKV